MLTPDHSLRPPPAFVAPRIGGAVRDGLRDAFRRVLACWRRRRDRRSRSAVIVTVAALDERTWRDLAGDHTRPGAATGVAPAAPHHELLLRAALGA